MRKTIPSYCEKDNTKLLHETASCTDFYPRYKIDRDGQLYETASCTRRPARQHRAGARGATTTPAACEFFHIGN